jgi:hypothetical protein
MPTTNTAPATITRAVLEFQHNDCGDTFDLDGPTTHRTLEVWDALFKLFTSTNGTTRGRPLDDDECIIDVHGYDATGAERYSNTFRVRITPEDLGILAMIGERASELLDRRDAPHTDDDDLEDDDDLDALDDDDLTFTDPDDDHDDDDLDALDDARRD